MLADEVADVVVETVVEDVEEGVVVEETVDKVDRIPYSLDPYRMDPYYMSRDRSGYHH